MDPSQAESVAATTPTAAYVHIPFCRHRCGYCNFALVANRDYLIDRYLAALALELSRVIGRPHLHSLYLGGGTPSHLSDAQLAQLFTILRERLDWNAETEVTLEANPIDLQRDRSALFRELGINRVSLGVQSFQPAKLKILERDHSASQIARAVENCRKFARSISIDLIFATPSETAEQWHVDLELAQVLDIDHVSTYELTYEKGTRFWSRRSKGLQAEADEDLRCRMYDMAICSLTARGFEHYEISSFARPHHRPRHNQVYWSGAPYWGFGSSASGFLNGVRYTNAESTLRYIKLLESGERPVAHAHALPPIDLARELLAIGLRRLDGVGEREFQQVSGFTFAATAGPTLERLQNLKLIRGFHDGATAGDDTSPAVVKLTERGILLYDSVAVEIIAAATAADRDAADGPDDQGKSSG